MTDLVLSGNVAQAMDTALAGSYESSLKKTGQPGLPQAVVETLLDKLASDDVYRALFQKNPAAALEQIGAPNAVNTAQCIQAAKLPSKEVIQQTRAALSSQLTSNLGMLVFKA